jgi:hypothetical protein
MTLMTRMGKDLQLSHVALELTPSMSDAAYAAGTVITAQFAHT